MAISSVRVGQTDPAQVWAFKDDTGAAVPMPTGTAYTWYLFNPETTATLTGTGTFDTTNQTSGSVTYTLSTADTTTWGTGAYKAFVGYVKPGGGQGYTDAVDFEVEPFTPQ